MRQKYIVMKPVVKLEKAIDSLDLGRGKPFYDLFDEFLSLQLSFFCNNPNDRQKKLYDRMRRDDEYRRAFTGCMTAYGDAAEDCRDPLGEMFMLRISHGHNGQFFTPENVCIMMAQCMGVQSESLNDPTCGSGRMLLAGLKVAREAGHEPEVHANDLSYTCAQMTLLNLCANTASGMVTCGDGLRLDYDNYHFFKIDRIRNIFSPTAISTYWQYTMSDVAEVEEMRRQWWRERMAEGWYTAPTLHHSETTCNPPDVATKEPATMQPEPLPVEVVTEKNGQIAFVF